MQTITAKVAQDNDLHHHWEEHEDDTVTRLERHVYTLAGEIGERNIDRPDGLRQAVDYISHASHAMDYITSPQFFYTRGVLCNNLELTIEGCQRPDEIILIGAHYDSLKGCPGANDNASGVAAMLEIARNLRHRTLKRSVRFVAFTNEEPPFRGTEKMGSWVYAYRANLCDENIKLAVMLESLGYFSDQRNSQIAPPPLNLAIPNRGNFLAFVSNLRSAAAARRLARQVGKHCALPHRTLFAPQFTPALSWGDQSPFWLHGYRAVTVSDTAAFRYPFHHSAKDTPQHIDYTQLAEVSRGLSGAIADLAND